MKVFKALVRMVRNSDRRTELLSRLVEARNNQSTAINERLDRLIDARDNQSTVVNERLDRLIEAWEDRSRNLLEKLDKLIEAWDNQSTVVNEKLDRQIEAQHTQLHAVIDRLDKGVEAGDNQSTAVNERLDKQLDALHNQFHAVNNILDNLVEAREQSTAVDERLDRLAANQHSHSRGVKEGLDKIIEILRADTLDKLIEGLNDQSRPEQYATFHSNSGRKVYICHSGHENDRTYAENVSEFCDEIGVSSTMIELRSDGNRPELLLSLEGRDGCILGFNSHLDHSWIGSEPFLAIAEARNVPVTQWFLDHPSSRWSEFSQSTSKNSRFLFHSEYSERYFHKYCLANCVTASVVGVGPNKRSRVSKFSRNQFFTRHISCLIPLNLMRIGGTVQELEARLEALDPRLSKAVIEAFMLARHDLVEPLEAHLVAVLDGLAVSLCNKDFNFCMQVLEEKVQVFRRLHVFRIARDYPVLIQSDDSARSYADGGIAEFAHGVGMQLTLSRMPACRAVVSVSHLNDMIHDRTLNGLNAGCVNIIEDSLAHRAAFQDRKNALFFRYEDDSLRECLDLVCSRPEEAYPIAEAGLAVRDEQPFRFGGFHNIVIPRSRLRPIQEKILSKAAQGAARALHEAQLLDEIQTSPGKRRRQRR
jgi:hypothetical protein